MDVECHIQIFQKLLTSFVFSDISPIHGYDELWIMGDNFAVSTYRPGFLFGCPDNSFIKANFEFKKFINSRFNSNDRNYLSRLRNTIATAINTEEKLPKVMLVVLDNDIVEDIAYTW